MGINGSPNIAGVCSNIMPESTAPSIMVLPLDVFYQIAEMLEGDSFTLRRLALTSRAFLPCARSLLYKNIAIVARSSDAWRLDLLSRTFRANPQLGALVKSLKLVRLGVHHLTAYANDRKVWSLTSDFLPFYHLRNLHTLNMQRVMLIRGIDDLIAILGFLPSLKKLVCDDLVQDGQEPMEPLPHPLPAPHVPLKPPPFPVLHELVITDGPWSHWAFARRLLLNHRGSVAQLESIIVSLRDPTEALWWVPIIRTAGHRLRTVSMSIADTSLRLRYTIRGQNAMPVIGTYPNDHAYVFDNLSHCHALRALHLKYRPDETVLASADRPIEELCEVLERSPTPWPYLERLELWMADREGAMVSLSDQQCTRLASVLTDRARFPHFSALVLRILLELWSPHDKTWSARPSESQPDGTATVERWKRAFKALERAPGVVLDVAILQFPYPRSW
ncbi:hypothetical protein C8Q70DRAFT_1038849 [Cubamyces menziesii]|nr:hypothetical protein C8Q70DRAFT_1038849 [Cubamyces menziesii]